MEKTKKLIFNIILFLTLIILLVELPNIVIEVFNINLNKLSNPTKMFLQVACDMLYLLIIYLIYHKKINKDFKEYFKTFRTSFELSFKYYLIGLIIMFVSNAIITFCFTSAISGNEELVRTYIDKYPLYMLFSVAIYAPLTEELIFRHSIKNIIEYNKKNIFTKYLYILSSGLIFAAMHILGKISSPIDYLYIIPYASLGISFAALYHKTDNIFSTITVHSMHNTIALILYLSVGGI